MYFLEEIFGNDLDEILHHSNILCFTDGFLILSIYHAFSGTTFQQYYEYILYRL